MSVGVERLKRIMLENQRLPFAVEVTERSDRFEPGRDYALIGMRRVGKTYALCGEIRRMMREGEAKPEDILFLNFEDDRLSAFETKDFDRILEAYAGLFGSDRQPVLFLEEIGTVPGWERFVRRLADAGHRIFVTGSNAEILSPTVLSTLRDRFLVRMIRPFSFSEYLRHRGVEPGLAALYGPESVEVRRRFDDYLEWGGLPDAVPLCNYGKREWLRDVCERMVVRDVSVRKGNRNVEALRSLVRKLAESVGEPTTVTRLRHALVSRGHPTAKTLVAARLDELKDAFLIAEVPAWRDGTPERRTFRKYYFTDNGMLTCLTDDLKARLVENLVALELIRRYGNDGLFFHRQGPEVDFFLPEERLAVQTVLSVHDPEVLEREAGALVRLAEAYDLRTLLILTPDDERDVGLRGRTVRVRRLWKWLLEKEWNPNASS